MALYRNITAFAPSSPRTRKEASFSRNGRWPTIIRSSTSPDIRSTHGRTSSFGLSLDQVEQTDRTPPQWSRRFARPSFSRCDRFLKTNAQPFCGIGDFPGFLFSPNGQRALRIFRFGLGLSVLYEIESHRNHLPSKTGYHNPSQILNLLESYNFMDVLYSFTDMAISLFLLRCFVYSTLTD